MKLEIWAAKVDLAMARVVAVADDIGIRHNIDPELISAIKAAGFVRDPKIKLLRSAEATADLLEAVWLTGEATTAAVDADNGPNVPDTAETGVKPRSRAKKAQEG